MHVLTMSSMFDTNPLFHRSHSSSNIPDLSNVNYTRPTRRQAEELPRSGSFSSVPSLGTPDYGSENKFHQVVSVDGIPLSSSKTRNLNDGNDNGHVSKEERP